MEKFDYELIGQIIDNYIGGICVFDYDTDTKTIDYRYVNDGFFRMLAVSKPAGMMLLNNIAKTIIPSDLPIIRQWIRDVIDDNGSVEEEFKYVTLDGQLSWVSVRGNLYERNGTVNTIICTVSDITEKKSIEEEFMTQYEFMNTLMDIGVNFDYNVRTDVCEVRAGKNWQDSGNMLIDHYMERVDQSGIHPDDRELFVNAIKAAMKKPMQDTFEYRAVTPFSKKTDYKWLKCSIMSIMGLEGYVTHVLGLVSDINAQKMQELELKLRADKDSLTNLLNKGATEELIQKKLSTDSENEKNGALILMDVDNFKNVNDSFGHAVGDEVLAFVGKILLRNFKGMDVVGRVGGDEFMVFMGDIKSPDDARIMVEKIKDELKRDCTNKEVRDILSLSIGISIFPDDGDEFMELYKKADSALYESKNNGKDRYSFYR